MSIITKTIALEVANKITSEKFDAEIKSVKGKLAENVIIFHDDFYTKNVLEVFRKNSHLFDKKHHLYFSKSISIDKYIRFKKPILSHFNQDKLTYEQISILRKLNAELIDINDKKEQLHSEVYNALIQLKTYKKVSENLPKLAKYLPKVEKTEVAINFDKINSKL
jgi:hypothetical protein